MSYEVSTKEQIEETSMSLEDIYVSFKNKMIDPLIKNAFQYFCYTKQNQIFIDYRYIKYLFKEKEKETETNNNHHIIFYIINQIKSVLQKYEDFTIHINFKHFTIIELERKYKFISEACEIFQQEIPLKMKKCYVYNAPFVFSHLYKIISSFLTKETRQSIQIYK